MNSSYKPEFSASVRHAGSGVREVLFNKLQPDGSYGTFCTYESYYIPKIIDALEKKLMESNQGYNWNRMTFVDNLLVGVFACAILDAKLIMFLGDDRDWWPIAEFDVAQLPSIIRELKRCARQ